MSESPDVLKWIGAERRAQPPITREEHDTICSASERKLNERFELIFDRFVDGTARMNRIETSIGEQKSRTENISKLQYELATHIEQIDKTMAETSTANEHRMNKLDASLQQNTAVTQEIKDLLDTAKGAFEFFGYIGSFLKWGLGLGGAILAFWVALKDFRTH